MTEIPTNDIYQAAYLHYRGFRPRLTMVDSGTVSFVFPCTEELMKEMSLYVQAPTVKLPEYVSSLKIMRARMLARRKEGNDESD